MQDTDTAKRHVIEKFKKRGFHHLTLEELAITQVTANWAQEFQAATNEDWSAYQEKALDRLSRAKFSLKWLTKETNVGFSNLFTVVTRGDLKLLEEYVKINDIKSCMNAVDDSKKTCLHIACREGHSEIVEYLVNRGWAIEARDKLLSTPLHLACSSGASGIVGFLIMKGADVRAKDNLGRNSLLFAVCSPSTETVEVLLKHDVSLLDSRDYTGRSSLHYAVFNPHTRQVDIIRTLLEGGISVDIPDDEMKTPLHHACDSSKPRGIRLLLKWGANLGAKDSSGKTPVDLSTNPSIKQLVTLYGKSKPDGQVKTSRVSMEKLPKISQKSLEHRSVTPVQSSQALQSPSTSNYKEKLMSLLRKVQEAGVQASQHIKKPSLYSGTWVEGLVSTQALHSELSSTPPAESVIKVFNVLFPYPKALPAPEEDEISGLDFFGTGVYKTPRQDAIYIQDDGKVIRLQQQLDSAEENIKELQRVMLGKDSIIQELQFALKGKAAEYLTQQTAMQEARDKLQAALKQVPTAEEVKARNMEKQRLVEQVEGYRLKFEESEKRVKELKVLAETLKIELDQRPKAEDVNLLKENLKKLQADDRNLRFKAGQIFLSSLESTDDLDSASPEGHLQDDEILKRLETSLNGNPPSFKQRLTEADSNKDTKVTKGELAKVVGSLMLPPQDIIVILRIAGFRKGVVSVSIDSIANILSSRQQRKENLENMLFAKLLETFEKSNMSVDQAFDYLDVNKDGSINFQELSGVCDYLHLNLSREDRHALFAVLDSDHNGTISLEELKSRLASVPPLPKPIKLPDTKPPAEPKKVNSRYQEPREDTPVSSAGDPKEAAFQIQREGKGMEAAKPNIIKETPKVAITKESNKAATKKINGSLVIGIVRGKDLGTGSVLVQIHVEGAEKALKTPAMPGPNPDWKFKGRIRLYDTSTTLISNEVTIEASNDKGLLGSAKIPWQQTLDFPNSWAIKSEYPILEPNGRKKGSVFVHLMWCPKEAIHIEGAGSLSVQTVSFSGFPKALLQLTINESNLIAPLNKGSLITLKDLVLKQGEPIPSLKCSILKAENREVILWRNLSIEVALGSKEWTQPLQVPLNGGYALSLKFLWVPQTEEEERKVKAVIKIQAMFKGMRARKNYALRAKTKRKLLGRKALKSGSNYYLLSVIEDPQGYLLELHSANSPAMYEVIASVKCARIPLDELFKSVKVGNNDEILLESSAEETKGSLGIEIVNSTCLTKCFIRAEFGSSFVHSAAGPPWNKKVMIQDVVFTEIKPFKVTLISVEKREELCKGLVNFEHSLATPDKWTEVQTVEIGKYNISLKLLWSVAKPVVKVPLNRVEEGLKKKSARVLKGRRGISRNKRYYLLSIFESLGVVEIELHIADDPKIPMYLVSDKVNLSPVQEIESTLKKLEISKDHKLILPKPY